MRKRFRKLVREGWHVVQLDRKNLWRFKEDAQMGEDWGDGAHYRFIRTWCAKTFAKESWEGRLLHGTVWKEGGQVITKEFIFKNEKDKTMFMLKWK